MRIIQIFGAQYYEAHYCSHGSNRKASTKFDRCTCTASHASRSTHVLRITQFLRFDKESTLEPDHAVLITLATKRFGIRHAACLSLRLPVGSRFDRLQEGSRAEAYGLFPFRATSCRAPDMVRRVGRRGDCFPRNLPLAPIVDDGLH